MAEILTKPETKVPPPCPRCGSRLFLESDFKNGRLFYFWHCDLGCARSFGLDGNLLVNPIGTKQSVPRRRKVRA